MKIFLFYLHFIRSRLYQFSNILKKCDEDKLETDLTERLLYGGDHSAGGHTPPQHPHQLSPGVGRRQHFTDSKR